jgi:hypothetical protein
MNRFFEGRQVVVATMHGKEKLFLPTFELLGLSFVLSENLNTDQFGSFSGEIPRIDEPIETLRKKCKHAQEITGIDLVVASEGSFGPHPFIPFVPANEELVMLKDYKNDVEVVVKELSTETNFDSQIVENLDELFSFASKVGFPSHFVILKNDRRIVKGISDLELLRKIFLEFQAHDNSEISVETDMRAMSNPTRMKIIGQAVKKMEIALLSVCPSCSWPNFTVKRFVPGLPCGLCQMPTDSVRAEIVQCDHCGVMEERPTDKKIEDPTYCNYCNP